MSSRSPSLVKSAEWASTDLVRRDVVEQVAPYLDAGQKTSFYVTPKSVRSARNVMAAKLYLPAEGPVGARLANEAVINYVEKLSPADLAGLAPEMVQTSLRSRG